MAAWLVEYVIDFGTGSHNQKVVVSAPSLDGIEGAVSKMVGPDYFERILSATRVADSVIAISGDNV